LRLQANTGVPGLRGCPPYTSIAGTAPLVGNQWSQVLGTYDGQTLRLYVNGLEVKNLASAPGACAIPSGSPALLIGGDIDPASVLAGDLDELIIYNHALSADEIAALYAYQLSWTEDRERIHITVDLDNPTAQVLLSGTPVYPNAPVVIPIGTDDATSGVVSARLCQGSSCGSPAPHCTAPDLTSAWCPIFTPSGEGIFTVSAVATDRVGRTGTSAGQEVRIDDTPPNVSFSGSAGDPLNPVRDSTATGPSKSGTAGDPALSNTSVPGSGCRRTACASRSIRRMAGCGAAAQTAALNLTSGTWTVDYVLSDSEPNGCYTAEAVAVDALAANYPDEAANHTRPLHRAWHQTWPQYRSINVPGRGDPSRRPGRRSQRQFLPVKLSDHRIGRRAAGITLAMARELG
jgi:hypothetical protein